MPRNNSKTVRGIHVVKYLSSKKGRATAERFVEKEGFKPGKKE